VNWPLVIHNIFDLCWGRVTFWVHFVLAAAAGNVVADLLAQLVQPHARPLMKELYTLCMSLYSPEFPLTPVRCLPTSPPGTWFAFDPAAFGVLAHMQLFIHQFWQQPGNANAPVQAAAAAFMIEQAAQAGVLVAAVGNPAEEADDANELAADSESEGEWEEASSDSEEEGEWEEASSDSD